jgi:chromosome partitioning protein
MILNVSQAIEKTGLPRSTFNRKVKSLNIPKINRGGKTYYEDEILDKYFPSVSNGVGKVISFAIQKGGVGKTTICLNLSIALAKIGKKVLAIDFDPQANLTGQFEDPEKIKFNIANAMGITQHGFTVSPIEDVLIKTDIIDLLPSTISFAKFDVARDIEDYDRLSNLTIAVKSSYDYIMIDCPPTLDIKLLNALVSSDIVIIPNTPSRFSIQGMKDLKYTINKVRKRKPGLKVYTILNEFVQNQQISAVSELVRDYFPVLETKIPRATDIEKAQIIKDHLDKFSPKKFKYYEDLAAEVINL